eukprot:c7909_g1_i2.p2 GENE.c7909_g1_i2~~c7909_g1_i2.p2  ORF type:complete len:102 (+),score=26.30 c7909_g1_i2:789-1094(+)
MKIVQLRAGIQAQVLRQPFFAQDHPQRQVLLDLWSAISVVNLHFALLKAEPEALQRLTGEELRELQGQVEGSIERIVSTRLSLSQNKSGDEDQPTEENDAE